MMEIIVSDSFLPLLDRQDRYLVLYGGAGSGKSEFAGRKVFFRCMQEGGHRILILRKVRTSLLGSVVQVMKDILDANKVLYVWNKTDRVLRFLNHRAELNELYFDGLDDPEKIKSRKGITSTWMEEATEFTKEDFDQIDLRLRGETRYYKQLIMTFNPDESVGAWLRKEFGESPGGSGPGKKAGSFLHNSTIWDNPIDEVRIEYARILDGLTDPVFREIYRDGRWARPKGVIFNWPVLDLPDRFRATESWGGGDFGYSVDPAAFVRIHRVGEEAAMQLWIELLIYERGLSNPDLADRIKDLGISEDFEIYFDSAEPKSIDEISDRGLNILPAAKGPDSVRAGLKFMQGIDIRIVKNELSDKFEEEVRIYKWKQDKLGEPMNVPVKWKDHAIDGSRYGIFTHLRERREAFLGGFIDVTSSLVFED